MYVTDDTIAAIATAPGEAAIGLVRLSGPAALAIAQRLFRPAGQRNRGRWESHRVYYGTWVDPVSQAPLDEVLVTYMQAPRSYTRQDVIEVGCHGGFLPVRRVLRALLQAGARLAEPGEFTWRALAQGRIDLAQAEAVCDMIRAQSDAAAQLALSQLEGALSREIQLLREQLLGTLALLEASIDFPEEDLAQGEGGRLLPELVQVEERLLRLLARAGEGRVMREGIRTTLVGKPNVGKSSLLNALLGQERAIVHPQPGTTRDLIEETLVVGGLALVLRDTAGIHGTEDRVEQAGVARAHQAVERSDLLLVVLDDSQPAAAEDAALLELTRSKQAIILLNKTDLQQRGVDRDWLEQRLDGQPVVEVSALTCQGIEELGDTIRRLFLSPSSYEGAQRAMVASLRHQQCLEQAARALAQARAALSQGEPWDLVAIDLRESLHALGQITGDSWEVDMIDRIFQDFCLGK